jgi:hypothetical protein
VQLSFGQESPHLQSPIDLSSQPQQWDSVAPYFAQPIDGFSLSVAAPEASADASALDRFVTISYDEFMARWEGMAESGHFERFISKIPTDTQIQAHLSPKGFVLVHSDTLVDEDFFGEAPLLRTYVFAQSQGECFLIEFLFDTQNLHMRATFKCQNESRAGRFVGLLELQKLLY